MTVSQARDKAVDVLKRLNEGENPNATRRAPRDHENGRLTLRSTFERYAAEGARAGELKLTTIGHYRHTLNRHLTSMLDRTMLDIGLWRQSDNVPFSKVEMSA